MTLLNDAFPPPLKVRIYYEDTDSGGVVYYANYLRFAERARTEWIRAVTGREGPLWREDEPVFMARHAEVDYLGSARLDDCLTVTTDLVKLGGASLTMQQSIKRDDVVLNRLKIVLVCVTPEGKVLRIPPEWRQTLSRFVVEEGAESPHGTSNN